MAVNFDRYTNNYSEDYAFSGVVFGENGIVLETELNEVQEILRPS